MHEILRRMQSIGIVPVIALSDPNRAVPLARALLAGGVACAEVTFRTAEAEECIRRMTEAFPEMLIGAGTVLTPEQVNQAKRAGAKFIVSPGFNPKVVRLCATERIPIVPGCVTPSEMEAAMEMGLTTVKFFPAEQAGGLAYIKAVSAPYPNLFFMPTGGINAENLERYAAFPKVLACGGSWMVSKALSDAENDSEITRLCCESIKIIQRARART